MASSAEVNTPISKKTSTKNAKQCRAPKIVSRKVETDLSNQWTEVTFQIHARSERVDMDAEDAFAARCEAIGTNEMRTFIFVLASPLSDPTRAQALRNFVLSLEDLDFDEDDCMLFHSKELECFLDVVWRTTGWEIVGETESACPRTPGATIRMLPDGTLRRKEIRR